MANPSQDGAADLTKDQVFDFYNQRLTEVLQQHNPAGLNTIGALLNQFPGKEHMVYIQICRKCGVEPCDPPTRNDFDENGKVRKKVQEVSDKVSQWLREKGYKKWAGTHQFRSMEWETFIKINSRGKLIELGVIPREAEALLKDILAEANPQAGPAKLEQSPQLEQSPEYEVGENCLTQVISSGNDGEKWLNARITRVNTSDKPPTYDIFVYNSKAFGVPPEAVNVPAIMLKKGTEKVKVAVPEKRAAKRPQFQQGDRVRVFGLRSHKSYNGLCGTVLLYVPSERRYQVRLDTNDVIAIKQRNVAPEHGEAPKGPSDEATRKKHDGGADEKQLAELMAKLMKDNPDADPGKLGEFAAGYLLAKQKLATG